jgi:hypothetical protein
MIHFIPYKFSKPVLDFAWRGFGDGGASMLTERMRQVLRQEYCMNRADFAHEYAEKVEDETRRYHEKLKRISRLEKERA